MWYDALLWGTPRTIARLLPLWCFSLHFQCTGKRLMGFHPTNGWEAKLKMNKLPTVNQELSKHVTLRYILSTGWGNLQNISQWCYRWCKQIRRSCLRVSAEGLSWYGRPVFWKSTMTLKCDFGRFCMPSPANIGKIFMWLRLARSWPFECRYFSELYISLENRSWVQMGQGDSFHTIKSWTFFITPTSKWLLNK